MCLLVGLSTVRGGEDVILEKSESLSAVGTEGTESWSNLTSSYSITTESWSSDSDCMCLHVGLSTVRGGEDAILEKSESLSAVGIEGTESWSNLTSSSVQSLLQHTH